jgi:hypothetical protein
MNLKKAITVILLVFVAASVVYLLATELGDRSAADNSGDVADANAPAHQVIAYYFYGYKRCPTCLKIEATAKEVIETAYPDRIKNGSLVWKPINFEAPENAHFADEFQLVVSSLVLVEYRDGKPVQWKNLEDVWDLIGLDDQFKDYIKSEVESMLSEV